MGFPSTPSNGQTATVNGILYTYSSARTAWVRTSTNDRALFTASNIAPTSPTLGDKWYYIAGEVVYEYINDGTTNYWVDTSGAIYSSNINTSVNIVGETIVAGNIIPSSNIVYTLGNVTHRWKDLYLSGNTIYLGGATITTSGSNVSITNPAGGSFSVSGSSAGNATATFGNVYSSAFYFANGTPFASSSYSNVEVAAYLTKGNAVVGTSFWTIPVGTTAERPASAPYGATRFNSQTGWLEVYANGAWGNAGVNLGLGASATSAAASAIAIKNATGTTTDGWYWINLPTVGATRVYCDMNTNGGGWMLAAKVYSNNTQFNGYDSADWTSTTIFNETQEPTYGGHIKTNVFVYYAQTAVRMCAGSVSNNLYETGWSSYGSLKDIFSSGTNRASQNSRATWITWNQAGGINYSFGSQPNCNAAGANQNYSYKVRLGVSMNNEGDCSSNDSFLGFGGTGSSPGSYGFGSSDWNSGSYLNSGYQIGYIWVK